MPSSGTTQPVRFLLNERIVEVTDAAPTTSILNFLRQSCGRMGTKEGCAEGDCGACTVVIGTLDGNDVKLNAVNACIQFLPTLDGKALFTVEDLKSKTGDLHPVQQAMVDCHGSQCGFCTPGFVMSLWALYNTRTGSESLDEVAVRQAITGNLCRCTGYRPIIEAGKRMTQLPKVALDFTALAEALKPLRRAASFHYMNDGKNFYSPRTLADLMQLRAEKPLATVLGGGTDVGLWVNKQLRDLGDIIYIGEVSELKQITDDVDGLTIGAAISLNDAYTAIKKHYPEMNEMWERFASTPIRNTGTLGGNIANGSPIGDSMPALIALGSRVKVSRVAHCRQMPLEDLYVAYQQKAMDASEILESVTIPKPSHGQHFRTYKLSKRFDSDISAVCAAFMIVLDGDFISQCRIAFGGMAATPRRALQAEKLLIGKRWDDNSVRAGMQALAEDFSPLRDMRASSEYRMTSAQNLLYRFYLETRPLNAMKASELSVFA